jgi:predicted  nucleic acid-binding Zn-ribbon protein
VSDRAQAERQAFNELQLLVGLLAEELAGFRVRALTAEQKLRAMHKEAASPSLFDAGTLQEKLAVAETENAALRERLARATDRTRGMLDRVRFLRQQTVAAEVAAGAEDES